MKLSFVIRISVLLSCTAILWSASPASAAIVTVPGDKNTIYDAIGSASDGDEIRVANNHIEATGYMTISGKTISLISYAPDFSTPAPGAQLVVDVAGSADSAIFTVDNSTVTIKGFSQVLATGGNVFALNSNVNLNVADCVFTGITASNTAAIKNLDLAENINVDIEGTTFTANGRAIWFNKIGSSSSLDIRHSAFLKNISFPIEWRTIAGTNNITVTDTVFTIINNRQIRLLAYDTAEFGTVINNSVFERCTFESLPAEGSLVPGRSSLKVGGVPSRADASSTMTITVSNSVFNLINGIDDLETVALDTQDDTADRRFEANFDHCTIVFGGLNQCGFRLRENNSTVNVSNCIVDGNGEGRIALRAWRGTINSRTNLLNAATLTYGNVVFSGSPNEAALQNVSPNFVDRVIGDFRLGDDSPAIAAGEDLGYTVDILGNPRPNPVGTNPDLGAYERGVVASVSNWTLY